MNEEAGFLSAIACAPNDETARLVYADWLDDQGDAANAAKSRFVRFELLLADEDPEHLQQLAATLPTHWLVLLSRPKIEACQLQLIRPCPGRWDQLKPDEIPTIRRCATCSKPVRFCSTSADALELVRRGEEAVISPAAMQSPHARGRFYPLPILPPVVAQGITPPLLERPRLPRHSREWHLARQAALQVPHPEETEPGCASGGCSRPFPKRRKGGRVRNRNIQRDDWEE